MEHQRKVKSVEKNSRKNFILWNQFFVCFCFCFHKISHSITLTQPKLEFISCSTTSCWTCFPNPVWENVYSKDLKRQGTGLSARFLSTGEFLQAPVTPACFGGPVFSLIVQRLLWMWYSTVQIKVDWLTKKTNKRNLTVQTDFWQCEV